jgi:hypothetical protein
MVLRTLLSFVIWSKGFFDQVKFSIIHNLCVWHVICLLFISNTGCLYLQPFEIDEPNMAPTILHSDPAETDFLNMNNDTTTVFVIVQDENDPENLEFHWWISGIGPIGTAEPLTGNGYIGSKLQLPHTPSWNGRTLNCAVYDSFYASAERSWFIQLDGEI